MVRKKSLIVFSITSDIGRFVAKKYQDKGYIIYGTYRKEESLNGLKVDFPEGHFYICDASNPDSIDHATSLIKKDIKSWDILISCPCTPVPIAPFIDSDIDEWEKSFYLNSPAQLRFMHKLIDVREKTSNGNHPLVLFFAGGGTNNAVHSFSAYTSAKIHLIKMFEFLSHEDETTKYTIIGPGWTNTKTHYETLKYSDEKSKKHIEVKSFLNDPSHGTPLKDIYDCIEWVNNQSRDVVSGRNFSVVHDNWKGENSSFLIEALKKDQDIYKLRRKGNDLVFE